MIALQIQLPHVIFVVVDSFLIAITNAVWLKIVQTVQVIHWELVTIVLLGMVEMDQELAYLAFRIVLNAKLIQILSVIHVLLDILEMELLHVHVLFPIV